MPFNFKSATSFAPIGYPETRLIRYEYPTAPLVLNNLLVMGEILFASVDVGVKEDNTDVIKKYGNKEGTTMPAQRVIPDKTVLEKLSINKMATANKIRKIKVR